VADEREDLDRKDEDVIAEETRCEEIDHNDASVLI
jgi:hypothetical protein